MVECESLGLIRKVADRYNIQMDDAGDLQIDAIDVFVNPEKIKKVEENDHVVTITMENDSFIILWKNVNCHLIYIT